MATTSGSDREREQREKEEREKEEREGREHDAHADARRAPTGEQLRGGAPGGAGQQAGNITGAGPSGARGAPAAANQAPTPDINLRWYAPPGHSGASVLQVKAGDVWVEVPTVSTQE